MTTAGSDDGRLPDDFADEAGQQLLAVPAAQRPAILEQLVAAHPEHAAALRQLYRDLQCVDQVLAGAYSNSSRGRDGGDEDVPDRIGGHRVIRRLGEGAFGIVWLCAQEAPVTRRVAVKVLRPDTGGKQTLQRFAAERQVLAAQNHPAITQVFDAGELPDGRPFFVMEFVDGQPLRSYCETRGLAVRDRLRLFADVCRGIAHAHTRGIVHRDLKPANVLVVDTETGPMPKIIDFGIAKALVPAAGNDVERAATEAGRVVGTPGYMSPEQAGGRVDEIDARSDVFALGVMLYELLTGELPWPRGASATTSDPLRPSQRVTTNATADRSPAVRQRLAAELRGDLDWITAKALARDRDDRYPTAKALAEDVDRHLRGDTVSVGPPSVAYRLRKFVRRNRVAVVAVTLASGLVAVAWLGWFLNARAAERRAEQAERTADERAAIAAKAIEDRTQQAALAVERLLARAGDERLRHAPENDAVRKSLAQDALGFYRLWLHDRPDDRRLRIGRCRALVSLSQVHWQLGQTPDAERTSAEAITEAKALHDEAPADVDVRSLLADALRRNGRALITARREAAAIPLLTQAVEHLDACVREQPRAHTLSLSSALRELASAFRLCGRGKSCLDVERRSVAVIEQLLRDGATDLPPQHHTDLAIARSVLAHDLVSANLLDEAAAVTAAATAGSTAVTIDRDHVVAAVEGALAEVAQRRRDLPQAIEHNAAAVAAGERWRLAEPGRFQPSAVLLEDLRELASLHDDAANWNAADDHVRRAIEVADAMVRDFPDDIERLATLRHVLLESAHRLHERLRRPDLVLAETCARRAVEVDTELARRGWERGSRSRCLVLLATVVEANGGDTTELWDRVANTLVVDADVEGPENDFDFVGWLGVVTSRLRHGRSDVDAPLAQAARWIVDAPRQKTQATELEWTKARVAMVRGDAAALEAAAKRTLQLRDTWMGRWRAADCLFAASLLDDQTNGAARRDEAAKLYRAVVAELVPRVERDPLDPWFVVPWGFASLQLARIEAVSDRLAEARALLDAAFPGLEAIADLAHRDLWLPDVFTAAQTLRSKLAADDRR